MWGFRKRSNKRRYQFEKSNREPVKIVSETADSGYKSVDLSDSRIIQLNSVENSAASLTTHNNTSEAEFAVHISKYIGETVTIFVASGGVSGAGFTGILIKVNNNYLQLITRIGPFPACTIYNTCKHPLCRIKMDTWLYSCSGGYCPEILSTLGSSTYIPIEKIVSFVHNSV